jgi:hypothetical protein
MNPHQADCPALKGGNEVVADSAMTAFIFKIRLSALIRFIQKNGILGRLSAFVWRIEY